ncbi:MAG: leucyl/phenylalanyl-tRNA--protein transferase [Ignavibacteriae bacterium]|nr:leucyl/phenylalanyl-tRNA--protein transferase [Ignavibacteriota bacterium]
MFRSAKREPALDPEFLLIAYCSGYFPMASSRTGAIEWYSPDQRAIIPLDNFRISRSLRRVMRRGIFDVRIDTAFERVMRCCAERDDTWISEEIITAYCALHARGYAHSIECWHDNLLAGGLYGVAIRGAFFGESMFSKKTDASKVALAHLVARLTAREYTLLDTQFMTEHLRTVGAVEIPRSAYIQQLSQSLENLCTFVDDENSLSARQ